MKTEFTTMEEYKAKPLPKPEDGSQKIDLAGVVQRARLKAIKERAEWDKANAGREQENPYEEISDEEILVLAGEELTTKQMKTLLHERQLRGRRRKP